MESFLKIVRLMILLRENLLIYFQYSSVSVSADMFIGYALQKPHCTYIYPHL